MKSNFAKGAKMILRNTRQSTELPQDAKIQEMSE